MPTVARWTRTARRQILQRRAACGRHDLGRGQERARRRDLPVARAAGRRGGAVQGAEHEQQLRRHRRRRRDRPRAGDAGARVRARAERRVQPGAAQAGQRPVVPGRRARQGAGHGQRAVLPRAQGRAARRRHRDARRPARRATTWSSARAPARPPRSTCGRPTSRTWGSRRRADLPVVVVGDIDRGGVLAHLFGTLAVLDAADQARIAGFVINKFRGDPALLAPGLDQLRALTGRPTLGVVPWADRLWLDAEDSLSAVTDGVLGRPAPPLGSQWLRVAVVRLPRISNATDAEALACEPGVAVRYVTEPSRLRRRRPGGAARLEGDRVRPGVAAPHRPRRRGGRARDGRAAGARDLRRLPDAGATDRRSARASRAAHAVAGLGLLDLEVEFARGQAPGHARRARPGASGARLRDPPRAGRPVRATRRCWTAADAEGSDAGAVLGTHWHGLLENDGVPPGAAGAGRGPGRPRRLRAAPDTSFAAERDGAARPARRPRRDPPRHRALEHVISHGARRRTSRS